MYEFTIVFLDGVRQRVSGERYDRTKGTFYDELGEEVAHVNTEEVRIVLIKPKKEGRAENVYGKVVGEAR